MEVISPEGLRQDGRTATCLRDISCRLGLYDRPNGSAYIEMGNTKVLAAVYGPREVLSDVESMIKLCNGGSIVGKVVVRECGQKRCTFLSLY